MKNQFIAILLSIGITSCGYTNIVDACKDDEPLSEIDFNKPDALEIPFYISATMAVYPDASRLDQFGPTREICTTHAFKEMVNKVLQLYDSVPTLNVVHKYAGTFKDPLPEVEGTGALYVVLNHPELLPFGVDGMGAPAGVWGAPGTLFNSTDSRPTAYPGGNLWLSRYPNLETMIHEIGHTLGLSHIPSNSSVMSYEGQIAEGWNDGWYYRLSEQDRAGLTAAFPTADARYYTIKGTVKAKLECDNFCNSIGGPVMVHVVNTVNGKAYSIQARRTATAEVFSYVINMMDPGSYKIVAMLPMLGPAIDATTMESSWYIDSSHSSNDPAAATTLTVDDSTPILTDIDVVLNDSPAAGVFNVIQMGPPANSGATAPWRESAESTDTFPMYLSPGESTRYKADMPYGCHLWGVPLEHCEPLDGIQVFGSNPDVTISETSTSSGPLYDDVKYWKMRITAAADAVPGDRLVVATAGGKHIVGLIGINILDNATKPYYLDMTIKDIELGRFDAASILNPNYWK